MNESPVSLTTRKALEAASSAVCKRRNASDWPCNGLDFDDEMARVAISTFLHVIQCSPDITICMVDVIELAKEVENVKCT